jgi:hypothetical protein
MALNHRNIADDIISKLDGIGINSEVNDEESQTALMIREIVKHVVNAIVKDAEVIVIKSTSTGAGNMGAPVLTNLVDPGKGIIK